MNIDFALTSTVTVDDDIRRKLKRLAAMLDTTQGEIIQRALQMYEKQVHKEKRPKRLPKKVLQALREASAEVRRSDPDWARISHKIEGSPISIDEFVAASWGREL